MATYMRLYHSGGGTVVSSLISFVQDAECLRINRIFLPVKMVFFFFNAAMASIMPYLAVFMSDLGLTAIQTGIARGAEPLLHVLVGPLWGSLSDRYSKHKAILIMAIIFPGIFYFSTQFVPPVKVTMPWIRVNNSITMAASSPMQHSDNNDLLRTEHLQYHDAATRDSVNKSLNQSLPMRSSEYSTASPKTTSAAKTKTDSTLTFVLLTLLVSLGRLFLSPFNPILDSTVVRMTKEHASDYGRQRMFASLGFGSFSIISGAVIDAFGRNYNQWNKYTPMFYMYAGLLTLVLLPVGLMKFPPHIRRQAIYRNVGALFLKLEFVAFLLAAFTSGFSLGAINTFLFIFIAELDGPHILMGLNITVSAMSEATCMYFSKRVIQKLGHKNVFNLVIFCYALRHLAYSVLQNPWLVVPVAILHGVCFGCFWPTCTSYVNLIAPVGMEASVQSIAHSTYFGLGRGLGMVIGGVIFNQFGGRNMFRSIAGFCGVVLIILWLVQVYTVCAGRRRQTLSVQTEEI